MLTTRTVLSLALFSAFSACAGVMPNEDLLVGTWQFTGIDATGRMVLRRDHTSATLFHIDHSWQIVAKGSWHVEGSELVTVEKPPFGPSVPGDPPRKTKTTRLKIRDVRRDTLVFENGSPLKRVQ